MSAIKAFLKLIRAVDLFDDLEDMVAQAGHDEFVDIGNNLIDGTLDAFGVPQESETYCRDFFMDILLDKNRTPEDRAAQIFDELKTEVLN